MVWVNIKALGTARFTSIYPKILRSSRVRGICLINNSYFSVINKTTVTHCLEVIFSSASSSCHLPACSVVFACFCLYIYIYIYIYIYGNHKTLISHHGCSYYLVITEQKEQTIFCITFLHLHSSDASF